MTKKRITNDKNKRNHKILKTFFQSKYKRMTKIIRTNDKENDKNWEQYIEKQWQIKL